MPRPGSHSRRGVTHASDTVRIHGSIAINIIDPTVNFIHSHRVRAPVGDLKP